MQDPFYKRLVGQSVGWLVGWLVGQYNKKTLLAPAANLILLILAGTKVTCYLCAYCSRPHAVVIAFFITGTGTNSPTISTEQCVIQLQLHLKKILFPGVVRQGQNKYSAVLF